MTNQEKLLQEIKLTLKEQGPNALSSLKALTRALPTPAAGAEFTLTVPAGEIWFIKSIAYLLTTSASVATRRANMQVTANSVLVQKGNNTVTQTASLAQRYFHGSLANYNATTAVGVGTQHSQSLNALVPLLPGDIFSSQTDNLQVGDAFTQVSVVYERYYIG